MEDGSWDGGSGSHTEALGSDSLPSTALPGVSSLRSGRPGGDADGDPLVGVSWELADNLAGLGMRSSARAAVNAAPDLPLGGAQNG